MTTSTNAAKANETRYVSQGQANLIGTQTEMSTKDRINAELASTSTSTKAKPDTAKASRGFTVKRASKDALATAKGWMVAYLTKAAKGLVPSVAFNPANKDRPQNFAPMLAVGFGPGWLNDADGSAKVDLIQQAYGLPIAGRKLGFPAMASQSTIAREKTMRGIGADWIGRADAKGIYRLVATKPNERVAMRAVRGAAKPNAKANAKATTKASKATKVSAKAKAERSNGAVTVSVDKALRSAAKAAERAAQRAANRVKVANESAAAKAAKASAQADIEASDNAN